MYLFIYSVDGKQMITGNILIEIIKSSEQKRQELIVK
jgi:hypothetical protein